MSAKHPIISVTGSSGAGTTTVKHVFEQIFRREGIDAATIEGDSFHRYDRATMRQKLADADAAGNRHLSHFGPGENLFEELEETFRQYGENGTGKSRYYIHDDRESELHGAPPGSFTEWGDLPTPCRPS